MTEGNGGNDVRGVGEVAAVDRAVFYNIYVSDQGEHLRDHGLAIVKEQLQQVQLSRNDQRSRPSVPIYYNLIGNNVTADVQRICRELGLPCRLVQYSREGDEGNTLDRLFDYCLDNPTAIVTYLHDKGSYHPKTENDDLRFLSTRAVLSKECQVGWDDEQGKSQCNICGARFSFVPHLHYPGNMFTARCSYLGGLVRPTDFPARMRAMVDAIRGEDGPAGFDMDALHVDRFPHQIGLGRFAYEHWATSHPDVQPCDVYPGPYRSGYVKVPKKTARWTPKLQKAGWLSHDQFPGVRHEWYCGRGRWYEFRYLYGKDPPPDSFLWDQYGKPTRVCPHPIARPPVHRRLGLAGSRRQCEGR
jgi:hypothetical protein